MDRMKEDGMYSPILGQWTPPPYAPIPSPTESWSSEEDSDDDDDDDDDDDGIDDDVHDSEEEGEDSDEEDSDDGKEEEGGKNVNMRPHSHERGLEAVPTSKSSSRRSSHRSTTRRSSIPLSHDGSMEDLPPEDRLLLESDRVQRVMSWQLLDIVSWLRNTRNYHSMSLSPERAFRLSHESADVDLSFVPSFPPTEKKPEHVKRSKKAGQSFESRFSGGGRSTMMERSSGAKTSLGFVPTRKDRWIGDNGDDCDHVQTFQVPRNVIHDHVVGHQKTYSTEDIPHEWYSSDDEEEEEEGYGHHDQSNAEDRVLMDLDVDTDQGGTSYGGFTDGTDALSSGKMREERAGGKKRSPFVSEYDTSKRISFVPERDERSLGELLRNLTKSLGGVDTPITRAMMKDDGAARLHDASGGERTGDSSLPDIRRQNIVWEESTESGGSDATLIHGLDKKYAGFLQRKKMRESDITRVQHLLERQCIARAKEEGKPSLPLSLEEERTSPSLSTATSTKGLRADHPIHQRDRTHWLERKESKETLSRRKKERQLASGSRLKRGTTQAVKRSVPAASIDEERRMLMDYFNRIHPQKTKIRGERHIAPSQKKATTTMLSAESIPLEGHTTPVKHVGASYSRTVAQKPGRASRSIHSSSHIARRPSQVEKSIDDMLRASGVYVPLMHADRASQRATK
jgi:hypothetical protein